MRISGHLVFCVLSRLALGDCTAGANLGAAAAGNTGIGVDVINLALGDSLYGAYGLASTTSHTVVTNYVSHNFEKLK